MVHSFLCMFLESHLKSFSRTVQAPHYKHEVFHVLEDSTLSHLHVPAQSCVRRRWLAGFVLLSSRTCAADMHAGNQNVVALPTEWSPSRNCRIKWPLGIHCSYGHAVKWVGTVWLAGRSTAARTCRILGAHQSHDSLIERKGDNFPPQDKFETPHIERCSPKVVRLANRSVGCQVQHGVALLVVADRFAAVVDDRTARPTYQFPSSGPDNR